MNEREFVPPSHPMQAQYTYFSDLPRFRLPITLRRAFFVLSAVDLAMCLTWSRVFLLTGTSSRFSCVNVLAPERFVFIAPVLVVFCLFGGVGNARGTCELLTKFEVASLSEPLVFRFFRRRFGFIRSSFVLSFPGAVVPSGSRAESEAKGTVFFNFISFSLLRRSF